MTSRRSFMAASLAVPMIVTLEPNRGVELHSPPPVPRHEQIEQSSEPSSNAKDDGVLAFTGVPLAEESRYGLAAVIAGVATVWAAKGKHA